MILSKLFKRKRSPETQNNPHNVRDTVPIVKFKSGHENSDEATSTSFTKPDTFTGFFNDGTRRIDAVLVVSDGPANEEALKIQFLINAIHIGMQIECSTGRLKKHAKLVFVKIHAPEEVLNWFADEYDLKFYFKEQRMQLLRSHINLKDETKWLEDVKEGYGGLDKFTTAERIEIVYNILLYIPYGPGRTDIGILRLLKRKIFIDMFALHDGPYEEHYNNARMVPNARQILYYNWTLKRTWYKPQPLNLVHEYFGDRVALQFAFLEYYDRALRIAAIVGIAFAFFELFDTSDNIIIKEVCFDNTTVICPLCRRFSMCPFKKLSDFCIEAKVVNTLDNPYLLYYAVFVSLWVGAAAAAMFISSYQNSRRLVRDDRQAALELQDSHTENFSKPEYKVQILKTEKSLLTGMEKAFDSRSRRILRLVLAFLIIAICTFTVLLVLALMIMYKVWLRLMFKETLQFSNSQYIVTALYGAVNVGFIYILEKESTKLSYILTDYENHQTQMTYDRSLVMKLHSFTFCFTFSMLIYIAYFKGAFYTYPSDPNRWYKLFGLLMNLCTPFGCLDDVWVMLMTMLVVKQLQTRILWSVRRLKTDYNQGDEVTKLVPCWEREYLLKPITNRFIMSRYREIVTQFGFVTLFVAAFPFAPFCALLANVWDLRAKARLMLVGCRRPMLLRSDGLGAWRDILVAVAYGSALTNGLTVAFTTKTIQRMMYLSENPDLRGFVASQVSIFNVEDFLKETGPGSPAEEYNQYKGFRPDEHCHYVGSRYPPESDKKYQNTKKFYRVKFFELLFIFIYEHAVFALVFIFHYIIPAVPRDVQEASAIENRIKNDIKARDRIENMIN